MHSRASRTTPEEPLLQGRLLLWSLKEAPEQWPLRPCTQIIHQSVHPPINPSINLSDSPSINLSDNLFISLSDSPSINLSDSPSIHSVQSAGTPVCLEI